MAAIESTIDPEMAKTPSPELATIPSVNRLLHDPDVVALVETYGHTATSDAVRGVLADARAHLKSGNNVGSLELRPHTLAKQISQRLETAAAPSLKRVFNLTGTVLHTNLGRAPLPPEVVEAIAGAALQPSNLEFDIDSGRRGDRDNHLEDRICALTGAEAATVVNNNAAAVLLTLNSLALRNEEDVSRGELIEMGGSFRMRWVACVASGWGGRHPTAPQTEVPLLARKFVKIIYSVLKQKNIIK